MSDLAHRPYRGLARFDDSELDERFFFGRDRETELVADNLVASRLTILYGPSGVGKSSLLRAGVVRRLRALVPAGSVEDDRGTLPVVVDAWRDDAVAAIAAAATVSGSSPDQLADALQARGEVYLILDQVEEYFTYHGRQGSLRDALAEILSRPQLRVHVLLGIRDDALAELDAFKGRVPNLFGNVLRLDHLDPEAARDAILEPLAELEAMGGPGVRAEPALVAAVIDQVASGRIERRLTGRGIVAGMARRGRVEAPYLQLVMDRIWEVEREQGSSVLRVETLARLGGAGRIVQEHLERALAGLSDSDRQLTARLFHQLVTPSGTKIAHGVGDLSRYAGEEPERLESVLHALSGERVVRALPSKNGGGTRYEIFHDVLADAVLEWGARHEAEQALAEERAAVRRRHRRLARIIGLAVVALAAMGLLTAYALGQRGEATRQAERASAQEALAEQRAESEIAARAEADENAREATRQRNAFRAAAAKAAAAEADAGRERDAARIARDDATAQAAEAEIQRDAAQLQKREAESARRDAVAERDRARAARAASARSAREADAARNASEQDRLEAVAARQAEEKARLAAVAGRYVAQALTLLPIDPEGSLQLALRGARLGRPEELDGALRAGLLELKARRVLPGAGVVRETALSTDGRLVLVPATGGVVRVFETETGKRVAQVDHGSALGAARLSPDGAMVITGGQDGVVRGWETRTGRPVWRAVHGAEIRALAVSDDGGWVASAAGASARVWAVSDGADVARLPHSVAVDDAVFSPGGRYLLTLARDARIFETAGWRQIGLLDQPGQITTAAFSPSGGLVATGGRDNLAMIWTATGERRHRLPAHGDDVSEIVWSPNGEYVATASVDNSARVFRADTGTVYAFLGAHTNRVTGVAFSPDGSAVATSSLDGSGRLWTGGLYSRSAGLYGHLGPLYDIAFTPDGRSVVTASDDGSARVWRHSVDPIMTLVGRHTAAGRAVAHSPRADLIASVGLDGSLRLWRRSGEVVRTVAHGIPLVDVAFSADGTLVVTAGQDGTARMWRVSDGGLVRSFDHGAPLLAVATDRAGGRIATAGVDGIVRVWPRDGGAPRELRHGGGGVAGVAFSPDGVHVATAGEDREGRIWRAADGKLVGKLTGRHEAALTSIAYSPDGRLLVTGSLDADAYVWDARTREVVRALRGHTSVVSDVAFSPDGRWIATAGPITVGLWVPKTGRRIDKGSPIYLRGHVVRVRGVAFAPDSRRVVSIAQDATVRTYLCELCGNVSEMVRRAERSLARLRANLTPAERAKYLGG